MTGPRKITVRRNGHNSWNVDDGITVHGPYPNIRAAYVAAVDLKYTLPGQPLVWIERASPREEVS